MPLLEKLPLPGDIRDKSSVTQSWYHIAVIGTDLAGLIFAALAARAGYRVVVFGQGDKKNAYKHQGFWFLRQLEHLIGFQTSPVVQRVFAELSLGLEMKNRPQAIDGIQLATPRMRLDVSGQRRIWERDCERELPDTLHHFDRLDARLRQATQDSATSLGLDSDRLGKSVLEGEDVLAELGSDARVRAVVEAPLSHLSGLWSQPMGALGAARLWTHLRAGLFRFPGGLDGLKQVFVRKIRDQASDVRPDSYVQSLVVKRGKVVALELAERGEAVGCELVILNHDPHRASHLIPTELRESAWLAAVSEPVGWRMMVNVGVDPRVLPAAMGPDLVWVGDPRTRLIGDNCLWVSRPGIGPHAGGDSRPSAGVVQVSAVVEARSVTPSLASLTRTRAAALTALRQLVPWLDDHLKVVDVPALVPERDGLVIDQDALVPVYGRAWPGTLGVGALGESTPVRNVLMASDHRYPGLGFEGTCLTALHTLKLVSERVRLHRGLR